MIGVNVVEKGTENGAITDFEGNFSLSLSSPNAVLVFSYIGYVSQEVSAKNQNGAKIVLKEDTETLDEVVVIGYGAVRKADVAGAVAVLDNKSFKDSAYNAGFGCFARTCFWCTSGKQWCARR